LQTPAFIEDVHATSTAEPETIWADTSEPLTSNADLASSVDTPPSSVTDIITSDMVPPLQYGDLADLGLIGWNPAGLIRWSLEVMQVSTGIPWFWTIVASTILWRIVELPFYIKTSRNVARIDTYEPELDAAKARMAAAIREGADKQQAAKEMDVYRKVAISIGSVMLTSFVSFSTNIGLLLGVHGMCKHPIEQLKHSGFDLLPDLTAITSVADPYFISSIIIIALTNFLAKVCKAISLCFLC
jgi:YidC/Oxa1 family membrane protein insertase